MELIEAGEFGGGGIDADAQAFDFSGPSVGFRLGDAVAQVGDDLGQARAGAGVELQARASDAPLLVAAWTAVGARAGSQFEFA